MALQKLVLKPGINREGTNYANESGWYQSNNVRFRSGLPEKIGGWTKVTTSYTYLGQATSLWAWVDFSGDSYLGIGTTVKYYIQLSNGPFNDITPILQSSVNLGAAAGPFTASTSSSTITITDASYSPSVGDYIIISGAVSLGGNITAAVLNQEYVVATVPTTSTYTIIAKSPTTGLPVLASAGDTLKGGATVTVAYEYPASTTVSSSGLGWGAGAWGRGGWGSAVTPTKSNQLRLWTNDNFGQDLVLAPRGGPLYYWNDSTGLTTRAQSISSLALANNIISTTGVSFTTASTSITVSFPAGIVGGSLVTGTGIPAGTYVATSYNVGSQTVPLAFTAPASQTTAGSSGTYTFSYSGAYVPIATNQIIASAVQEFIICMGANSYIPNTPNSTFDPMLVRWSDQANAYQWVPDVTNQAGEYRLTHGSYIAAAQITRQENLIWTDTAIYSMQYLGAPYVWGFQLLMDNITIISPNSAITVNGATYWMGSDKFYMYQGTVSTLKCDLKQYIFTDINKNEALQVFAGGNFGYNEIWWFYCSENATTIDRYVIYNYVEQIWMSGSMCRTAWTDSTLRSNPIAASYTAVAGFIGSIAAPVTPNTPSILTVSSTGYGTISTGLLLNGSGIKGNTVVINQVTGSTGGVGTYTVTTSQNIASTSITASTTVTGTLLYHENGADDVAGDVAIPIDAYIQSSDIDIEDGQHFGFIWRMLPDINFNGSDVNNPYVTMTVWPRRNSGAPYGTADAPIITSDDNYAPPYPPNASVYVVQQYTGQVYTRLRGRQISFRVESNSLGTAWQLGTPRYDVKMDGRR